MKLNMFIVLLILSINSNASSLNDPIYLTRIVCENNELKVVNFFKAMSSRELAVDVNSLVDEKSRSLVFRAIINGSSVVLQELLQLKRTDVNRRNCTGNTALRLAYTFFRGNYDNNTERNVSREEDLELLRLLLNHDLIDPNVKLANGNPLLIDMYNQYPSEPDVYFSLMEEFLRHRNIDINESGTDSETLLHKICCNEMLLFHGQCQNNKILKILLRHKKLDLNCLNKDDQTPLHKAVSYACAMSEQIDSEEPIVEVDKQQYVVQLGVIELLLGSERSYFYTRNNYGNTAYDIANMKNNEIIMGLMRNLRSVSDE